MAENFNRRRKKSFADEAMVRDLVDGIHRFSEKRYPFLVGTIVWILELFTKGLAFNLRAVTRNNLGSRTFGLFLVIEAFFLQKLILIIATFQLSGLGLSTFLDMPNKFEIISEILKKTFFWWPDFDQIKELKEKEIIPYIAKTALPMVYGYVFLLASLGKLFGKGEKRISWQKENSYSSGESIFFESLKNRKIGKSVITNDIICMLLEPLLIFVTGIVLWKFFDSSLGVFLVICSIATLYEEYKPYWRRKEKIQDKIDAEFEIEKINSELKAYDDNDKREKKSGPKKNVPVAFATFQDYERYLNEIKKQTSGTGGARIT